MNKARLLLFGAELLAIALLRLTFMLRRDKTLPRGSKVPWIKGKPVFKNPFFAKKPEPPRSETFSAGGWTPPPRGRNMRVPDQSPGE